MNLIKIISLVLTLTFWGCLPFGKTKLKITTPFKSTTTQEMSISSVQIINHQLIINGNNLDSATTLKVSGNSFDESFAIESQSRSQIIANSIRVFSFDVSKVFSLIISDANASATFPIDFSICNSTLNGKAFNCSIGASDKDVLSYDAVTQTWKPRSATSGLNYLGSFDASSNPSNGPTPYPAAGAYYIIGQDGLVGATNYSVGDWMVSNGSTWQKIDNSTMVHSVFNRTGAIVAQEGDYELDQLLDVDLPGPVAAGKVLKYDGAHWVAADDLSSGGAGSVDTTSLANGAVTDAKIASVSASKITGTINSTQILDGTIMNADINAAAAIDYAKLNIPNTTIPYEKLNIANGDIAYAKLSIANGDIPYTKLTVANGEIPAAKISGIPSVTTVLATTVVDGDLTHAPDGNAVYDSLALKLNTSGGSLTSAGTISNVPDPVGPLDVSNRQYTDTKLDKTSGGTVAGSLSLNTDLKLRGTTNYVTIKSDAATVAYTLTLPPSAGTNGYVLATNGSGVLSWVSSSATGTTMTGDIGGTIGANSIGTGKVTLTHLSATGTKDNTTYLRGDNTWAPFGSGVLATPLTSLSLASATPITASDTVLAGMGKLQKQITDLPGASSILATTITDADTTHAPNGNAVHDALGLKLDTAGGTMTGDLNLDTQLKLRGTTNYVTLKSTASTSAYTLTLPATAGTSGYVLSTDGSGVLSWISAGGGPATGSLTTDQQAAITIDPYGTGAGNTGEVRFKELAAGGTNYVALKSPDAIASNLVLVMPATAGSSGDVLTTNGSNPATLSWTTPTSVTSATLTGDIGGTVGANTIGSGKVTLTHLSATGTKDNTTYLRGDNSWASLAAGVLATPLTSLSLATGTAITASDTVLTGMGKLQKQITDLPAQPAAPTGTADATTYHAGDNTWKNFETNVRGTVLAGLDITGIDYASRAIASTDSALVAFNKMLFTQGDYVSKSANQTIFGSLKINSLTGFIEVPDPIGSMEATNKQYVDNKALKTLEASGILVPANKTILMKTCPSGWTDQGMESAGAAADCGGTFCYKCLSPATPVLLPADSTIVTDRCPANWTASAVVETGPSSVAVGTEFYIACKSPSVASSLPEGLSFMMDSCPANWQSKGQPSAGPPNAVCGGGVSCYSCEVPFNIALPSIVTGRNASATTQPGRSVGMSAGAGGSTSGNGGAVTVAAGAATSGTGGAIQMNAGASAAGNGGNIQLTSGAATTGNSGSIFIRSAPGGTTSGNAGTVQVAGGTSTAGTGGNLSLVAGGSSTGNGGSSILTSGSSSNGNGGAITISAGSGGTNGDGGSISINSGNKAGTGTQGYILLNASTAGFVGIGTSTPTTKLDVTGVVNASGGVTQVSDIRLKTNITFLNSEKSLEKLLTLRGILFDWKDQKQYGPTRQLGLIAQDVKKVFPNAVRENINGILTVSYSSLIAPIIESLKEIRHWLLNHDEEIASLKSENAMMKSYLCTKDPEAVFCK